MVEVPTNCMPCPPYNAPLIPLLLHILLLILNVMIFWTVIPQSPLSLQHELLISISWQDNMPEPHACIPCLPLSWHHAEILTFFAPLVIYIPKPAHPFVASFVFTSVGA